MPRVASEAIQSHHQAFTARRPAAADAKQQSAPFSALLDDAGGAPPHSPHDHAERPQPSSANAARSDTQQDKGTQRGQDNADNGNHIDSTNTKQPAADAKTEANAATDAKAGDAKAADGPSDNKLAPADGTDTAALAAATAVPAAPQPVAGEPAAVPAATVPDATALAAATDAPTAPQPVASEPAAVPAATVPGATDAAANAPDVAASKGATIQAADALSAQAQGAANTDAGTTIAADAKGQTGRKGSIASSGADGANTANASKSRTAKPGASVENIASSKTVAAASDGQDDPQAGSQVGAQAGSIPMAKGEPAHHPSRALGQDDGQKSGETRLQADMQAGGTADKPPADAAQLASLAHPADRFANLVAGAAPSGATATDQAAVPIAGLAVEIAARAQAGGNRFEIRLDPPELGRIDVRLDIDRDGNVTSRLMVEKAETLDLLRRDAPELERALQQAGLKTDDSGLQFALRDQSFGGQNQDSSDGARSGAARLVVPDPEMAPVDTVQGGYGRSLRLGGGIDIRV